MWMRIATSIRDVNTSDVLNSIEEEFKCVWRRTCIVNHDEKIVLKKTIVFNLLGNLNSVSWYRWEKESIRLSDPLSIIYVISIITLKVM